MRILFATTHDPDDRRAYSGTTYHMRRALERAGADVVPFGPLPHRGAWWMKPRKALFRLRGYEHERFREPALLHALGLLLEQAAQHHHADLVFSAGGHLVSGIRRVPFACWPDATFVALTRLYPQTRPFSPPALRNGHRQDADLAHHATALIYSSEWARASAIRDTGARPETVAAIPYGANLDDPPGAANVDQSIVRRAVSPDEALHLLFVGKDFARKGGPQAVAVAEALHRRGVPVHLHLVGPSHVPNLPVFVTNAGFLDAQTVDGRAQLRELYAQAHLFLFPTQADCTPMVLAEAMAYGVPCLTTDVGGIGSQITPGSGLLLSPDAPPDLWADAALAATRSPETYRDLARAARSRYDEALNWDVAATQALAFLEARLSASAPASQHPPFD